MAEVQTRDTRASPVAAFFAALMFLTRFPIPGRWAHHSTAALQQGRAYFPLVGVLVGAWGATVYGLIAYILPAPLAVIASMLATIVATGAFHEDGLADVCDGIGGGWERERMLEIMKDSRVGSFATVGLIMALLAKFNVLTELARINAVDWMGVLVAGHAVSRWVSSLVIDALPYAEPPGSKAKPIANYALSLPEWLIAMLTVVVVMAVVGLVWQVALAGTLAAALTAALLGMYYRSWIGGYTGDCLGSIQQVSEIVFYCVVLACG